MSIYRNPTKTDVEDVLRDRAFMRVLYEIKTGDLIAWPGNEWLHQEMLRELNLTEDMADNLGTIRSFEDMEKLVDWVGARSKK